MKIAIDTCIGTYGRALLEHAGHEVVVEADPGEMDQVWFARALEASVELVVSADSDLEILCYDYDIPFFQVPQNRSGLLTARLVLFQYPPPVSGSVHRFKIVAWYLYRELSQRM